MQHEHRIAAYAELMASKGVGEHTAIPPLWRLLWSWGLQLPPPLYMGFLSLFLLTGTCFGLLFGAGAWLLGNRGLRSMSLEEGADVALVTGLAFGLVMACAFRFLAHRHGLGTWSTFDPARGRV